MIGEPLSQTADAAHRHPLPGTSSRPATTLAPAVLVVDDDADLCLLLGQALEKAGFRVVTCLGPPDWELLERLDPRVVFLDIALGAADGTEVCRAMKRSRAHAARPVILISARPEDRLHAEAGACEADGYLTKPFSAKLVVDLAKHYAAQPRTA